MRLTRVKIAGFKSFVDPTNVPFPTNLTGVVGPNGCGKSNIIDAVRWVMGELSARHLRGDSMADVIFNGSGGRRPVGTASVELVFDNSDGKIGGTYATYNEISLKRVVSRDGASAYFINSIRCRRKDITTLFLGTGLGSRSYAIIEQGMISRVIEARSEDMRAFVEEAAGISRYKERRRETEARVSGTRENMERLQDLRDEVDKQIRHLSRQANQARRFQDLKNQERQLSAEVLALRLREIDGGAAINDRAMRDADLRLQQALAEQRSAEAAVEKQREFQLSASERVAGVQGAFYQQGAEVARAEQQLAHVRELRERQRRELSQAREMQAEVAGQLSRDESLIQQLRTEIGHLGPSAEQAQLTETARNAALEDADAGLRAWQEKWEAFNRELGGTYQTTQVERTRIEQLDDQLRRLATHADRLAVERDQLQLSHAAAELGELETRERSTRESSDALLTDLQQQLTRLQALRAEQAQVEGELESARRERESARAELVSLEALQKAALGEADREAGKWLQSAGLAGRPRAWDRWAPKWVGAGERNWNDAEPSWGTWGIPESEVHMLGDVSGLDVIELGCGTAYVSAWLARLGVRPVGIDNSPKQLETARRLQTEHGLDFPLLLGNAESVPYPDASFDLAVSEYGAAIWCDPYRWIPEAARLLRPGGRLSFLGNSFLYMLCAPDEDDAPPVDHLLRPQFGPYRFEWPSDESVEFHLPHGEMIRLLRASGFEIEDLIEVRAPQGATTSYRGMDAEWSHRWPSEEIWKARKRP